MNLRGRIQILLLFLVGAPLALLLFESYRTGRAAMVRELRSASHRIATLEAAELENVFAPARTATEGLRLALEARPPLDRDELRALVHAALAAYPEIYGAAVALDPAATPLGGFSAYAHRDGAGEEARPLPYDHTRHAWFRRPLAANAGRWSDPYFGEGGQALMVTYATPFAWNGRNVGIVEVDLDLDGLVARLRAIRPGSGGAVYLADAAGQVVAHPDRDALLAMGGERLGEVEAMLRRPGDDAAEAKDPITGRRSWLVEAPITALQPERGGPGWSVVVSWPLDLRLAPLGELARRMVVLYLVLGGAALLFLQRGLDATVARPVRQLAAQVRALAAGEPAPVPAPAPHEEPEELRELREALAALEARERLERPPSEASPPGRPSSAEPTA